MEFLKNLLQFNIIDALTLVAVVVSALLAVKQLRQLQLTTSAEFMADFLEKLCSTEHAEARRTIYLQVPHPVYEKEVHENWLRDDRIKWVEGKSTDFEKKLFDQIQSQLFEFDRMGLIFRKFGMDLDFAFDMLFDIIARLTIQLQYFVVEERKRRGKGYIVNFVRLARKNFEFTKRKYRDADITLMRPKNNNGKGPIISLADLENAVKNMEETL